MADELQTFLLEIDGPLAVQGARGLSPFAAVWFDFNGLSFSQREDLMNVWVLEEEHGYNGAAVVGVFTTREIALAAIVWNEPCVTGFFLSKLAVDQIHDDPSEEYIPRPFQPIDPEVTTNCPDAWTGPASEYARKLPAGDGPRS